MSDTVLDSCVLAKLVLGESDSSAAVSLCEAVYRSAADVVVLDIARVEVTNVIWKKWMRKNIDESTAKRAIANLLNLQLSVTESEQYLPRALELAMQYSIAVYDALFVAAVEALQIPGVTSDLALVSRIQKDFPHVGLLN